MTTTVFQFAERLLFGASLADKSFAPASLSYTPHPSIKVPELPARANELAFSTAKLPFPKTFEEASARGQALLFFANHELLAIELMALCLLRFPQAPMHFRKGLVHIIREEQVHLQMYLNRANELGVQVGSVPLNSFFWDCLSTMQTPLDFIVGMGMTFEQANLDHCVHYKEHFERVGDVQSVNVLQKVYRDEIRHVRHGLRWFRAWKPSEESDFFAHRSRLRLPMSLARAKGKTFDVQGRQDVGLEQSYIHQLQVYAHSKGRPSDVYVFTPHCELDQVGPNQHPTAQVQQMQSALSPLLLFLCKKDDIVVAEALPTEQLLGLQKAGVVLPQFVSSITQIDKRRIGRIRPWGRSARIARRFDVSWDPSWRELYGKSWGADCLRRLLRHHPEPFYCAPETVGRSCDSLSKIQQHLNSLRQLGHQRFVIKSEWGTAGRGSIRVEEQPTEHQQKWIQKTLRLQGNVVVEPELQRVVDYSVQIQVADRIKVVAVGRFDTNPMGQYLGHWLGAFQRGLPSDILRFVHGNGADPKRWKRIVEKTALVVGEALRAKGYRGPAGIDAMIYRNGDRFNVRPIVEVNPRYTMGRIAHEISKHVVPMQPAYFGIAPWKKIPASQMRYRNGLFAEGTVRLTSENHPIGAYVCVGDDSAQRRKK